MFVFNLKGNDLKLHFAFFKLTIINNRESFSSLPSYIINELSRFKCIYLWITVRSYRRAKVEQSFRNCSLYFYIISYA